MSPMKSACVLGDIVGSRRLPDRPGAHQRLREVLQRASVALRPVHPFRVTVGDEFQGVFDAVGPALRATLWLRLELLPDIDVRIGVGWGEITVLDPDDGIQDGPGWWAAREAIDAAKAASRRSGLRHSRTAYRRSGPLGPEPAGVNAALLTRDQLIGTAPPRTVALLRGALAGRMQAELADELGISPSAVSQRFRRDGLTALLTADELLGQVGMSAVR